MCKTCLCLPVAHGMRRKIPDSSPGPYGIWKETKFPLFKPNLFPKSTFIDKHFRRESMGKRFLQLSESSAHPIIAQLCRHHTLFSVGESERWEPITHHAVWGNYSQRRSHEAKPHAQVSRGVCCYPVIFNLYDWILRENKPVVCLPPGCFRKLQGY